jgi:hypothetical protein
MIMLWLRFKVWWQDGLYIYNPGKVAHVPYALARRYIETGKAEECNPPKWAQGEEKTKKKKIPGYRARIKVISSIPKQQASIRDLASEVMGEDD